MLIYVSKRVSGYGATHQLKPDLRVVCWSAPLMAEQFLWWTSGRRQALPEIRNAALLWVLFEILIGRLQRTAISPTSRRPSDRMTWLSSQRLEFLRFWVVGTGSFVIESVLLLLLAGVGIVPAYGRLISYPLSLCYRWAANRFWTFETGRHRPPVAQYGRYLIVQGAVIVLNLSAYWLLLAYAGLQPIIALAVASLMSMLFSFLASRRFVFSAPVDV
jgi:putative flippase GtrA